MEEVILKVSPAELERHIQDLNQYMEVLNDIKMRSQATFEFLNGSLDGVHPLYYYKEKIGRLDECLHYFSTIAEEINKLRICYTEAVYASPFTEPLSSDVIE